MLSQRAKLSNQPAVFDTAQVRGAPKLALRGIQRVSLKAGERRKVSFTLSPRDLSFLTADGVRQLQDQYRVDVGYSQPEFKAEIRADVAEATANMKSEMAEFEARQSYNCLFSKARLNSSTLACAIGHRARA